MKKQNIFYRLYLTKSFSLNICSFKTIAILANLFILIELIFTFQYDPEISIRFKSLVEKHATQFKGNNQVTKTWWNEIFHHDWQINFPVKNPQIGLMIHQTYFSMMPKSSCCGCSTGFTKTWTWQPNEGTNPTAAAETTTTTKRTVTRLWPLKLLPTTFVTTEGELIGTVFSG